MLTKAGEASDASETAEIKEKIQLAVISSKTNNSGELNRESLEEELTKEFGTDNYELIIVGKGYIIIVDNVQYEVKEDGTVQDGNQLNESNIENAGDLSKGGQYDGLTEETAYRINCIEDLVEWTNNYNTYKSKNIRLEKALDFQNISDYKDYKKVTTDINGNGKAEELITELTTGTGFKPIGDFSAIFDGQNNEIRNIYENTNTTAGLFKSALVATIKNLGITGNITSTVDGNFNGVGGIVGGGVNNNPEIINCHTKCIINAPNMSSTYKGAGGIIGEGNPILKNCYSESEIKCSGDAGGIIGFSDNAKIIDCYNLGRVNASTVGGIIGHAYVRSEIKIYNSYNIGYITGASAGGLLGLGEGNIYIYNSYNIGKIEGNGYSGGIIGYNRSAPMYLNNSFNVGDVCNNSQVKGAGIVGYSYEANKIFPDNLYYLNNTDALYNYYYSYGRVQIDPSSMEYLQSQEFANSLNIYVNNYNEEHKNDEGFIELNKWKYNQGNYPTFE